MIYTEFTSAQIIYTVRVTKKLLKFVKEIYKRNKFMTTQNTSLG